MLERIFSVGSPDDAELIALGKQFEPLHATYWTAVDQFSARLPVDELNALDAVFEQAGNELQPILRAISALQAHTQAGKRVKMLAVAHCLDCRGDGIRVLPDEIDVQAALEASVARDFLGTYGIELRAPLLAMHKVPRRPSRARGAARKREAAV
ncbi:hypothetical protein ACRBEV_29700 [Methylobacterium phyllosphaerae]